MIGFCFENISVSVLLIVLYVHEIVFHAREDEEYITADIQTKKRMETN